MSVLLIYAGGVLTGLGFAKGESLYGFLGFIGASSGALVMFMGA
jgi:hypothetical protein